ncbi:MAG: hypothetical protein ACE5NG_17870 [bacterium]
MKRKRMALISIITATLLIATLPALATAHKEEHKKAKWHLRGTNAIIVGGYGDNFDYGGGNTRAIKGHAKVKVNADQDAGKVVAEIKGSINPADGLWLDGKIKIVMKYFDGPAPWMQGGIAEDLFLHGATGRGPPVMPKVRTFLGGWGTADVYLNGKLVCEDLDAHFMYTDGARDEDYKVWLNATHLWNPMYGMPPMSLNGTVDPNDRELHIVVHSTVPDSNNFPPHDFWIHLNFEEVKVKKAPSGAEY